MIHSVKPTNQRLKLPQILYSFVLLILKKVTFLKWWASNFVTKPCMLVASMNIQVHLRSNSSCQVPTHCRAQLLINVYASCSQCMLNMNIPNKSGFQVTAQVFCCRYYRYLLGVTRGDCGELYLNIDSFSSILITIAISSIVTFSPSAVFEKETA